MSKDSVGLVGELVRRPLLIKELTFTDEQKSVIAHRGSPLVVLAGPGTGKTMLLVESALSRIADGQNPNSILLLTYGRERASELRDAVALRTTAIMHEPLARTFHSLAYSILKMKSHVDAPEPILMSGPEQEYFITQLLEGDIASTKKYWPVDLEKALTTHGFARELRDLILRASERGLSPQVLAKNSAEFSEPYWKPASQFWEQYLEVMTLQSESAGDAKLRIDPSQIVIEAYRHLKTNPEITTQLRERFTTILVDEFQESDPAQRQLLRELAGSDLVLCADADSAVGRFRGADPDQLDVELDHYRSIGKEIVLTQSFRGVPEIFNVGMAISSQFKGSAPQRARTCEVVEPKNSDPAVIVGRFRSQSEEAQFIAYQLRYAHLIHGTPWNEMAVILRTPGAQANALRRAFAQASIPVSSQTQALSGNPAIAPFLLLAEIAIGSKELSVNNCERLLLSEFGGADSVSLRRMRRALLASRQEDDLRPGSVMLHDAIDKGDIPIEGAQSLTNIYQLLQGARKILRKKNTQAEDLLWEIWSNARTSDGVVLSESWRKQALRGGLRGASADRDLDAVMQLFEEARRFAERFPHSKAESFIAQISKEDILGDAITAKGQRPDVVEIVTVHASKGREWEIVAVAGLQEGTWPNLRQRGSLLGSERLVERARHGGLPRAELDVLTANGLAHDERRLLYVALTRAKSTLITTAVQKDEEEPSSFFEEISTHVLGEWSQEPEMTQVPRPITPSSLVAQLRSHLGKKEANVSASLLKRLANEGLSEADVQSWSGVIPLSTNEPIIAPDAVVPVSPSSAESFTECGVKWFLEKSGGTNGDSTAQVLGSAIHAFAARMKQEPNLTEADLVSNLSDAWKLIDPNTGWVSATQLSRAVEMLHKFVTYHNQALNKREIVGVEVEFDIVIGRARIRGSVDRLEVGADGALFIVDFKTGSSIITKEEARVNKQMLAYQLAVTEGGFIEQHASKESAGAELVYLASKSVDASLRNQPSIGVKTEEFKEEIQVIAEAMGAHQFLATINDRCKNCAVRSACPIQNDGRMVME